MLLALIMLFILTIDLSFNTQLRANAETSLPTNVSISLSNEQIVVGMQVECNMLITPSPPTNTDVFHNLSVTVTSSFGTELTLGPFNTSSNGSQSTMFTPTAVGNYTFVANYAGETFNGSISYLPASSKAVSLVVTQTPTPTPTPSPTITPTPTYSPTVTPTPMPTPTYSPTVTPTPMPTPTLTSTASPILGNGSYSPLVRKLVFTPVAFIASPSLNSAKIVSTATTAAGVMAIVPLIFLFDSRLSIADPQMFSNMRFQKSIRGIRRKIGVNNYSGTNQRMPKFEELLLIKNARFGKEALITEKEIAVLATTILFTGLVMGYVLANGVPNVLNPVVFLEFFFSGLISACIFHSTAFFSDIYCSMDSKVQEELNLSKIGTIMFFVSGLLKFPFSSSSFTKACGAIRYEIMQQKKINALSTVFRTLILLLLTIPFAFMSISNSSELIGSEGLLIVLTLLCVSLMPISPLPGKEIHAYRKKTSVVSVSLIIILLLLNYFNFLTFWSYILIGAISASLLPIITIKLKSEKTKIKQVYVDLWFKSV